MSSKKRNRKRDTAYPPGRRRAWIAFVVLCAVGALLALELERLHVKAWTAPGEDSYCSVGAAFDCDAVATSPWSVWFGLPVALWGLAAYLTMGVLGVWGLRRGEPCWQHALAYALAVLSALGAIGLFALSHFVIGSICLMCVATYVVNFALAACAIVAARGGDARPLRLLGEHAGAVAGVALVAALVLTGTASAFPSYWRTVSTEGPGGLPIGVDAAGHSWIGAAGDDPSIVEIVEYSDYECPHCDRGHANVRQLVEDQPDRYRLVHRHYPLDDACNPTIKQPFHKNACRYAAIAWCAQQQGRFWETNDFLYANRGTTLTAAQVARAVDLDAGKLTACLESREVAQAIDDDLTAGRAAGVRGTPTFVIDGKTYPGGIPPEALETASTSTP